MNSDRKASKYNPLHQELGSKYKQIKFINIPLRSLGTVGSSSESFIDFLKCLEFSQPIQQSILSKMINITIRCTYFIFCRRHKPWTDPDLLAFKSCIFFLYFTSLYPISLLIVNIITSLVMKPVTKFCI